MPAELPYMPTVSNIHPILAKIRDAAAPARFTYEFLASNLGFASSNDRGIIKILKQLGFLNDDATPTPRYHQFRSQAAGGQALADGLREGWQPIFLSSERANEKANTELQEIFKTVTGAGEATAAKMASTFKALATQADWSSQPQEKETPSETPGPFPPSRSEHQLNLHHDVHVHLPPTSDIAVYRAIFQALREELL